MAVDQGDKTTTVFLQFAFAHTGESTELLRVCWQAVTHFLQRAVMKNDVGWHILLLGELPPVFSKGLPQRNINSVW